MIICVNLLNINSACKNSPYEHVYIFKVTPDILKGQQELVDRPSEDVTKLALFNYLKEG